MGLWVDLLVWRDLVPHFALGGCLFSVVIALAVVRLFLLLVWSLFFRAFCFAAAGGCSSGFVVLFFGFGLVVGYWWFSLAFGWGCFGGAVVAVFVLLCPLLVGWMVRVVCLRFCCFLFALPVFVPVGLVALGFLFVGAVFFVGVIGPVLLDVCWVRAFGGAGGVTVWFGCGVWGSVFRRFWGFWLWCVGSSSCGIFSALLRVSWGLLVFRVVIVFSLLPHFLLMLRFCFPPFVGWLLVFFLVFFCGWVALWSFCGVWLGFFCAFGLFIGFGCPGWFCFFLVSFLVSFSFFLVCFLLGLWVGSLGLLWVRSGISLVGVCGGAFFGVVVSALGWGLFLGFFFLFVFFLLLLGWTFALVGLFVGPWFISVFHCVRVVGVSGWFCWDFWVFCRGVCFFLLPLCSQFFHVFHWVSSRVGGQLGFFWVGVCFIAWVIAFAFFGGGGVDGCVCCHVLALCLGLFLCLFFLQVVCWFVC